MAEWTFERIYSSTGNELSNAQLTTTLAGAFAMKEDGRYLWVTNGTNGIYIYEWWGAASDHEPAWGDLDLLTFPRYDSGRSKKLRLVTVIKITSTQIIRTTREQSLADAGATSYALGTEGERTYSLTQARTGTAFDAKYITKLGSKMYVTNGTNFSEIYEFDIATQQPDPTPILTVSETFDGAPRAMNSNLCASGGRLWFAGGFSIEEEQDPIRQKLYALNPTTGLKSTYDLLCRPGLARVWLADGFNGFVYATCPNDVAVMKVNNLTGSMTQIRVNSTPSRIESGQDRRIWVNSFAGMLSLIDYDDDQVHNQYGTDGAGALGFQTEYGDPTKMWYLSGSGLLVRYDLNTLQLFEKGTGNDFNFTHPELANPDALLITQPLTYQTSTGTTVNVLPYLFLIQDGKLLAFRLYRYLYREAFSELNGNGAVGSGVELYFGE